MSENTSMNYGFLSAQWVQEKAKELLGYDEKATAISEKFKEKYGPERLKTLSGYELLTAMYINDSDGKENMCYALEFDAESRQNFGSIAGGTSHKYGLYFSKPNSAWITGTAQSPKTVSVEEAIAIAEQTRDKLVAGAEAIADFGELSSVEDYRKLFKLVSAHIELDSVWILKYYKMIFPSLFASVYSENQQRHILYTAQILPHETQFVRMGQIALCAQSFGVTANMFIRIIANNVGWYKPIFRIGTGEAGNPEVDAWFSNGYCALSFSEIGDYQQYIDKKGHADKEKISEALEAKNSTFKKATASRKANEICSFIDAANDETIVVAMNGQTLYGIGIIRGALYYDESNGGMYNRRRTEWLYTSSEGIKVPNFTGKLTSFYKIDNPQNLLLIYKLMYHTDKEDNMWIPTIDDKSSDTPKEITYKTGFSSAYSRNRIIFGAPGTGKSYMLNTEKDKLLANGGAYERVTFHPDYTYAHFVGTYKPVPCRDENGHDAITYKYVPGPFMRMYVKALKNSRDDTPAPFLLLVEEINRANVAAVFGDVFQLLDRDDDEVSEYGIQASEDARQYLAGELGGEPSDYEEIRLPDNFFIWATMNSADQGVFPMDTAFKRRWDFTYISINAGESAIEGKKVILGQGEYKREVEWNSLRKKINDKLSSFRINEDKLLGPYFLSRKVIPANSEIDAEKFIEAFKNKVLMYLYDDAAKQKRASLFAEGIDTTKYSSVCDAFEQRGIFAFCTDISSNCAASEVTAE